jgi:hypothetical protein
MHTEDGQQEFQSRPVFPIFVCHENRGAYAEIRSHPKPIFPKLGLPSKTYLVYILICEQNCQFDKLAIGMLAVTYNQSSGSTHE